jgi:hypothetical protein
MNSWGGMQAEPHDGSGWRQENEEPEEEDRGCPYAIMDVPRDAGVNAIRRACRKHMFKWHPDKNAGREFELNSFTWSSTRGVAGYTEAHACAWHEAGPYSRILNSLQKRLIVVLPWINFSGNKY